MIANDGQIAFWNSGAGEKWVSHEDLLEALHAPLTTAVLARAALKQGQRVLDIGCGTGALARAAAEQVGPEGHVTAIDVAAPLLARASAIPPAEGAAPISYVEADAQTHDLPLGGFDAAVSRLGVMFFDDPTAAFANLRRSLQEGGRLTAITWQKAGPENPWFGIAKDIVGRHFEMDPPPPPLAPGPLGFARADLVCDVLAKAGWRECLAEPSEVTLSTGLGAEDMAGLMAQIGLISRAIAQHGPDADKVAAIRADTVSAIRPHEKDGVVRLPTVMWVISAEA